jgi:hypothetical protein
MPMPTKPQPQRSTAARLLATAALFLCLSGFMGIPRLAAAQSPAESFDNQVKPNLIVPLPNFSFGDVTVTNEPTGDPLISNRIAHVPFLADYMAGIYKYAIATGGIFATVLMMVGGFQYLVGQRKAGLTRIQGAVTGLILVFATYAILRTVSPALVNLGGIDVAIVRAIPMDSYLMQTTTEDTTEGGDDASVGSTAPAGPQGSVGTPVTPSGSRTPTYATCPITLTSPPHTKRTVIVKDKSGKDVVKELGGEQNDLRNIEFFEKIPQLIDKTKGTVRERVVKIADAAVACGVDLGSCGKTVGSIYTLAGVINDTCLQDGGACPYEVKTIIAKNSITEAQKKLLYKNMCNPSCSAACAKFDSESGRKTCQAKCDAISPSCLPYPAKPAESDKSATAEDARSVRKATKKEAVRLVYQDLAAQLGPSGWPDSWLNTLQPGDALWIYNANAPAIDLGAHSFIFMGWKDDKTMETVEGTAGKAAFRSSRCLRASCSGSVAPTINIFKPDR